MVKGSMLDPFFDEYSSIKFTSRLTLGAEQKISDRLAVGGHFMFNRFKSYPQSHAAGYDPYTLFLGDSSILPSRTGYTRGLGGELSIKLFRQKKNSWFPIGNYFEFGIGFHHTTFSGYDFTAEEYNSAARSYQRVLVTEPRREVSSASVAFKIGKQILLDNFLIVGYGFGFRGHIPLASMDDGLTVSSSSVDLGTLFMQDVFSTDWLEGFVSVGYLL